MQTLFLFLLFGALVVALASVPFGGLALARRNLRRLFHVTLVVAGQTVRLVGWLFHQGEVLLRGTRFRLLSTPLGWVSNLLDAAGGALPKIMNLLPRSR